MEYAFAILFALFLWWLLTGAVLFVVGLPKATQGWSTAAATLVLGLAVIGQVASSDDLTILGAYCGFTCGLMVWAWQEMSFLTGFVTGPSKEPCPSGATGWNRFGDAAKTLLYHELAILGTAALLMLLTSGAPNQVGVWTFLVLWAIRLSTKFNVFLGVPNLTEQFLPDGLSFLKSSFLKRPMNLLFPVSVTISTLVTYMLVEQAAADQASSFTIAGLTLLATLLGLAVLEHWLLVLPLPAASLWSWGLKSRRLGNFESGFPSMRSLGRRPWIKNEALVVTGR